jgi:hypothetical protein
VSVPSTESGYVVRNDTAAVISPGLKPPLITQQSVDEKIKIPDDLLLPTKSDIISEPIRIKQTSLEEDDDYDAEAEEKPIDKSPGVAGASFKKANFTRPRDNVSEKRPKCLKAFNIQILLNFTIIGKDRMLVGSGSMTKFSLFKLIKILFRYIVPQRP